MMLREPWRTRLLFLSFAINLVIIPIATARYVVYRAPLPPGLPRGEIMIERMVHDLPPDDAERFRTTMEQHLGDIEAARARMEASRRAMSRAIGRSPFDQAAVQLAIKNWQTAWNQWSDNLGAAMLDALPGLSNEGRDRLAEAGRRRPRQ